MDSYFLGGKSLPFYMWPVNDAQDVRHHWYDANGLLGICLRIQNKSLDSLAVAGIQSDIPLVLSVRVVCSVPMCSPAEWIKPASVRQGSDTLLYHRCRICVIKLNTRISKLRIHLNRG